MPSVISVVMVIFVPVVNIGSMCEAKIPPIVFYSTDPAAINTSHFIRAYSQRRNLIGHFANARSHFHIFTAIGSYYEDDYKSSLKPWQTPSHKYYHYLDSREENRIFFESEAMAVPLLTLNSLLPSQSLFNEIQSIHETGFFHELDSFFCCRDGVPATLSSTQVSNST